MPPQDQDDAVQEMLLTELEKMQRGETTLLDGTKSVGYILAAAVTRAIDKYRPTHPRSRRKKPEGGSVAPDSRFAPAKAKPVVPSTPPQVDHVRLRNELPLATKPPLVRIRKHLEIFTDPDVQRYFEDLFDDPELNDAEHRPRLKKSTVRIPRRERARRLGWSVEHFDAVKRRFLTIFRHLGIERQDLEK
jgi:hypothetical protein